MNFVSAQEALSFIQSGIRVFLDSSMVKHFNKINKL